MEKCLAPADAHIQLHRLCPSSLKGRPTTPDFHQDAVQLVGGTKEGISGLKQSPSQYADAEPYTNGLLPGLGSRAFRRRAK